MKDIKKRFGKNVRNCRKAKEMTQVEVSSHAGLHQNYLSEIEKGKRNITLEIMQKLAEALNVEVKEFFEENHKFRDDS